MPAAQLAVFKPIIPYLIFKYSESGFRIQLPTTTDREPFSIFMQCFFFKNLHNATVSAVEFIHTTYEFAVLLKKEDSAVMS